MRKRANYTPSREVSSVKTDVIPTPQKDDQEEPSRWERHPGFSKFSSKKQTTNSSSVKLVRSGSNNQRTFETQAVAVDVRPPIDVDQPEADKKWGRYPGQARLVKQEQKPEECLPCRRKQVQAVTLDVIPTIEKDQPQDVKKWERYPNARPQALTLAERRARIQHRSQSVL